MFESFWENWYDLFEYSMNPFGRTSMTSLSTLRILLGELFDPYDPGSQKSSVVQRESIRSDSWTSPERPPWGQRKVAVTKTCALLIG